MPDDQVTTEEVGSVGERDWLATSEELPGRPRRRVIAPIPLALLCVLLTACGFIGGVLVEKRQTSSSVTGASSGLTARVAAFRGTDGTAGGASGGTFLGGAGFAGRSGGGTSSGRPTIGHVSYIDGNTLYVENPEGNTVDVTTSAGSTVTKTVTSSVKGIHPGETVVVQGAANSSGTIAASSISVGGTGGFGRGLSGLFGRAEAGGGGGASGRSARDGAAGSGEEQAPFR